MLAELRSLLGHKQLPLILMVSAVVLILLKATSLGTLVFLWAMLTFFMPKAGQRISALAKGSNDEVKAYWVAIRDLFRLPRAPKSTSPLYELCCYLIAAAYFVTFFLPLIVHDPKPQQWSMHVLPLALTVLGVVESIRRAHALLRRTWARWVGKIFWGALATIFTCIASAWSRQFTFQLTGDDPAAFPSFTALVAVILLPLTWWGLLYTMGVIWAGFEIIFKLFALLWKDGASSFQADDNSEIQPIDAFIGFLRPLSVLMALWYLWSFTQTLNPTDRPMLRQVATNVLVNLEYWPRTACDPNNKVYASKLDATHYSIASTDGWRMSVGTVTCSAMPH